jgi:hypothetical protein
MGAPRPRNREAKVLSGALRNETKGPRNETKEPRNGTEELRSTDEAKEPRNGSTAKANEQGTSSNNQQATRKGVKERKNRLVE